MYSTDGLDTFETVAVVEVVAIVTELAMSSEGINCDTVLLYETNTAIALFKVAIHTSVTNITWWLAGGTSLPALDTLVYILVWVEVPEVSISAYSTCGIL